MYVAPSLMIGGDSAREDIGIFGLMTHNFRLYATLLLLVEFFIVALGVRFVQLFAPVTLMCVIISIVSMYAGALHKIVAPDSAPRLEKESGFLLQ